MTITDRIEINPKVMMGKPVIRGTRLKQSATCKESEKVQSDRFSILIPLPFLRLPLADATRAKNLGSCSNL